MSGEPTGREPGAGSRQPSERSGPAGAPLPGTSGRRLPAAGNRSLPPLSLYIHIPWCVRKCPYCDFNSHNAPNALPQDEYVAALLRDLDQDLPLAQGRPLISVFFGGGTPSLFAPDAIARIIDGVGARLALAADAEITLETNPGTVEHGPFAGYRRAGINRISFGVQSFDDASLQRIGRIHDAAQAERAVKQAQDAGIDNLNLDLMYALPGQSLAGALADVEKAISLQTPHLSHYQLTLEPNTAFAANPPALPAHDAAWEMQEACQQRLAAAGLEQYEVSAYARPARECAHNLNYWEFGDYLGIGAGAHGKISMAGSRQPEAVAGRDSPAAADCRLPTRAFSVRRRWKMRTPRGYLEHAGTARSVGGDDAVDPAQLPFEFMLNALRLNRGFAVDRFAAATALDIEALEPQLTECIASGWLVRDPDRVGTTAFGRRFLNDVIASFLPDTEDGLAT